MKIVEVRLKVADGQRRLVGRGYDGRVVHVESQIDVVRVWGSRCHTEWSGQGWSVHPELHRPTRLHRITSGRKQDEIFGYLYGKRFWLEHSQSYSQGGATGRGWVRVEKQAVEAKSLKKKSVVCIKGEKQDSVGVRKESRGIVLIKRLCFRWMSAVFKRVHDTLVTLSMQTAVSDIDKSVLTELECPACKQYIVSPNTVCLGGHNICNTCRTRVSTAAVSRLQAVHGASEHRLSGWPQHLEHLQNESLNSCSVLPASSTWCLRSPSVWVTTTSATPADRQTHVAQTVNSGSWNPEITLENLSLQLKFPCRYSKYGCKDTFPYNAFRKHEAIRGYSRQTCPVDYLSFKMLCTWTGIAKDVKEHLQTAHKDLCEDYNSQHLLRLPSSIALNYSFKFLFATMKFSVITC